MIPILYKPKELDFKTSGIGRLTDCISAVCVEERNGAFEIEIVYPTDGIHASDVQNDGFILAQPADRKDPQPFRIYDVEKNLDGTMTIKAEHISYQLNSVAVMPFTATTAKQAMTRLKNNVVGYCPFTFSTDLSVTADYEKDIPGMARSLLGGNEGSILDVYGGEYEWDGYKVKLWENRGKDRGFTIRYGKNLLDLKQEESIESMYTAVLPYWFKTTTSEGTETKELVTLDEKLVYITGIPSRSYVLTLNDRDLLILNTSDSILINSSKYSYERILILDCSSAFDTKPTQAALRTYTKNYIAANDLGTPKVTMDVSFVDLWQTDEYSTMFQDKKILLYAEGSEGYGEMLYPAVDLYSSETTYPKNGGVISTDRWLILNASDGVLLSQGYNFTGLAHAGLCDIVTVVFEDFGIDVKAKVVKTEYDILMERYNSIEIGDPRTTLADTIGGLVKNQ